MLLLCFTYHLYNKALRSNLYIYIYKILGKQRQKNRFFSTIPVPVCITKDYKLNVIPRPGNNFAENPRKFPGIFPRNQRKFPAIFPLRIGMNTIQ